MAKNSKSSVKDESKDSGEKDTATAVKELNIPSTQRWDN
jgi:hypothetical protein